jgi:hypothetical protein
MDFDISPFALPGTVPSELRFEEPRDVVRVVVRFVSAAPRRARVSYLRRTWPHRRVELGRDVEDPFSFGWMPADDWFNGSWQTAAARLRRLSPNRLEATFRGLASELPDAGDYDVPFRRTLGLRIDCRRPEEVGGISAYTTSPGTRTRLRVELDAGRRTPGGRMVVSGYNAAVERILASRGVVAEGSTLRLGRARRRSFELLIRHMRPAHRYCNDDGHVSFGLDGETFTISLSALRDAGPIWFAERGFFIACADDTTSFADYRRRIRPLRTVAAEVLGGREQSYARAYHGQPRPHPTGYNIGWKHARQKFRVELNGDLVLHRFNVARIPASDTARFRNEGDGRFFFGLERWVSVSRCADPAPVPAYNVHVRRGGVHLEQRCFAVPLLPGAAPAPDATVVAMVRFRFRNTGSRPEEARLHLAYSSQAQRSHNRPGHGAEQDDRLVPLAPRQRLAARAGQVLGTWRGRRIVRCAYETTMRGEPCDSGLVFRRRLRPGASCQLVLKVPFVAPDGAAELRALKVLDFDRSEAQMRRFWQRQCARGAQVSTPEPHLDELHAAHPAHVQITDAAMPDDPALVNTSVGTSTYGNFSNESCMIVHDLDERGLAQEARRRLAVWVRYQGTAAQPGNFSDYDGMYFGAGGFESGAYNQHHGWVLWCLAEHYFLTGDAAWLRRIAASLLAGCDWVFRQRRHTLAAQGPSRGWERGFLPAGSLEDVQDFHYWLSTNALTWRGVDRAAAALEAAGHAQAARIRREADAYRRDLIRGFETMRQHAPLVRLRDGRWVPHYPSRLYCRGRDVGWIREVLEGSIYLLLSGLYDPRSRRGRWILDDYLDNRYMQPPYGYRIDPATHWFCRGGFSCQPNLLAGLLPHLARDEPEVFLWMFFNAWCACYREEIGAMVEHPAPVLGYDNAATFKTSDQANAVAWLRYMFVWADGEQLHLGRAVPRQWLADGAEIGATGVCTRFGRVGVTYTSRAARGRIDARVDLSLRRRPGSIRVRFRHPEARPIRSVTVNGRRHGRYDPRRGDVDITGCRGTLLVRARY